MKCNKNLIVCIGFAFLLIIESCTRNKPEINDLSFKEIKVGQQIWMDKNLNVSKFRNGEVIPAAWSFSEWEEACEKGLPAWCYYEFDEENAKKYGKLYNFYAVHDPRGLAPKNWRIPNGSDFEEVRDHFWYIKISNGKEIKTFFKSYLKKMAILFNQKGGEVDKKFSKLNNLGVFWCEMDSDGRRAFNFSEKSKTHKYKGARKCSGYSVRCVKVNTPVGNEVKIGKQVWKTKNLAVDTFRNGESIPYAATPQEWRDFGNNKKPCYTLNYGQHKDVLYLYNGYAVVDPRGLAPKGWHIPSSSEWGQLTSNFRSNEVTSAALRCTSFWGVKGTNSSGFSALPGGRVWWYEGKIGNKEEGYWWSSDVSYANGLEYAIVQKISNYSTTLSGGMDMYLPAGASIRLVKD